jgi:hypothetical protein
VAIDLGHDIQDPAGGPFTRTIAKFLAVSRQYASLDSDLEGYRMPINVPVLHDRAIVRAGNRYHAIHAAALLSLALKEN